MELLAVYQTKYIKSLIQTDVKLILKQTMAPTPLDVNCCYYTCKFGQFTKAPVPVPQIDQNDKG